MPPPPELDAGKEQVSFFQRAWSDLDPAVGGEVFQLDMADRAIRPLRIDPQENLAIPAKDEGGVYQGNKFDQMFDGDLNSVWLAEQYVCASANHSHRCDDIYSRAGTVQIDLKGQYLVDRILIVSGLDNPAAIARNFAIHVASEVPRLTYVRPNAFRPFIVEIRDNREQFREVRVPSRGPVAFVQVAIAEHNEDWVVHDVQIFGRGFVEHSAYKSSIIDLERSMSLGELRWSGARDSGAKVLIQTRSGMDEEPEEFWRLTGRGDKTEVSRAEYADLKLGQKAGITHDQANWSFWSSPYDFADSAGTSVVSPSPQRYFQFKVDFLPQEEDGGRVDFVELRASAPVASNLVGEVWPIEAEVGQQSDFTYVLRPTIRLGDAGFDQLEIETSSIVNKVNEVRIGDMPVDYQYNIEPDSHRLLVGFPRLEVQDSGALVEVDFSAQVLRYGATFDARVSDSGQPLEVPQGVNAGDATGDFEGNRVSVATAAQERDLLQVRAAAAVFTPNGDGFNDRVEIGYDILEVIGSAQVKVEVLDLSGRQVRQVYSGVDGIGEYVQAWDGRDDAGQLMAPGIYLYRVSIDADQEKVEDTGVLHTAY